MAAKQRRPSAFRHILFAAIAGYYFQKLLPFPHGSAVRIPKQSRPVHDPVDNNNDSLQLKHGKLQKIYERVPEGGVSILKGPETVVFGNDGTMYVLTEEAKLVKLSDFEPSGGGILTAKATEVVDLGMGRPLGGKFAPDGSIYIADAHLGLIRVRNPESPGAKVELVASRVKLEDGTWSQILYADDVAIGPKTGMVYFTDASDIAPDRIGTRTWDTMYMAKLDLVRGKRSGRLLQYDPSTEEVSILASDIWFANGVAVDKDETFVFLSETFHARSLKYHLSNGSMEVVAGNFAGYPDGADCSWSTGLCYAPLPTSAVPVMKLIFKLPNPLDVAFRNLLMIIPRTWTPKVVPYGGVMEIFPGNETSPSRVVRILQDPKGTDIGMLTGVTVHNDKLYLGSLDNPFVGVYDLSP